jgi:hypothetical protein
MCLEDVVLTSAISRFGFYKDLGEKTFDQLEEADFYFRPDSESNNIAVIIQHMSGNMISRWTNFLSEDGEKPWRNRDEEFRHSPFTKAALMEKWEKGWKVLLNTLEQLSPPNLHKTVYIRSEAHTVVDAILRQLAHYPYHVGQIVYIGKMIKSFGWKSLSIEKGGSAAFNEMKRTER